MSINTITYSTKSDINTTVTPAVNKVAASDMNEIKTVVNTNANLVGDVSTLTTTATTVVGAINELKTTTDNLTPELLFNDDNGKDNNIVLSSSAANYTYLEIFFYDNVLSTYNSAKLYNPNGKLVALFVIYNGSSGTNTQFKNAVYSISGTSITLTNNYGVGNLNNNAASTANKTNQILITRVLGYK